MIRICILNEYSTREKPIKNKPNGTAYRYYHCLCKCGNEFHARKTSIKAGTTRSCGCLHRESIQITKHGESKGKRTTLYVRWGNIIQRCTNPNNTYYYNYGGRGITVCDGWRNSFESFRDWALANGYADNLEIDRIDNNGPYSPDNCQWITREENQLKKRPRSKNRFYAMLT